MSMAGIDSALESDIIGAVDRGEIIAHFQPQVDLLTGRIVSVEALSRWQHPVWGLIEPVTFIPIAESTGVIHQVGAFMLDLSCTVVGNWRLRGIDTSVAVNVSAMQIESAGFADHVTSNVARLRLGEHSLTLEVTESLPIIDLVAAIERLTALRELGVDVSIDDFGVGFSTPARVHALPVSELKLDQSLVQAGTSAARETMSAIVRDVHSRGIRVVAEGVETEEQRSVVAEIGCDRAQGYLVGRPVTFEELTELLRADAAHTG